MDQFDDIKKISLKTAQRYLRRYKRQGVSLMRAYWHNADTLEKGFVTLLMEFMAGLEDDHRAIALVEGLDPNMAVFLNYSTGEYDHE